MNPVIKHLGCIMDGNRRWARKKGLQAWFGHDHGIDAVKETITFCLEQRIPYLTLYAFSIENFNRSSQELNYLFSIIAKRVRTYLPELVAQGVRIRFVGDRSLFPHSLVADCDDTQEQTKNGNQLVVNVLFCYGGQQEIIDAVRAIGQKIADKTVRLEDLSQQLFEQHLWMGDTPAPDLIIRTGGRQRLSNFLLYHAAYAELIFLDCLWPELTKEQLEAALIQYQDIQRNFGI